MEMIDIVFDLSMAADKLKGEKSFFKKLQLKKTIKGNKKIIVDRLNKKEFDVNDFKSFAWIIEFGKVKWPDKNLLLDGSDISFFKKKTIGFLQYDNGSFSLTISTNSDYTFDISIVSKKAVQHKISMHIDEDTGVLDLVRELLSYPIMEILDLLIEGDNENDKHVHGSS